MVALRREQTVHERTKRMRLEMQLAVERGELISKDLVEKQASFLLVALRQHAMSAPSAWSRRLLGINDARVMTERLKDMMTSVLEEIADLPHKVTNPAGVGEGMLCLSQMMTGIGENRPVVDFENEVFGNLQVRTIRRIHYDLDQLVIS